MKPTEKQIERLPKWARSYIAKLERDIAHHEVEQAEIENHMTGIEWFQFLGDHHAIPRGARVVLGHAQPYVTASVGPDGRIFISADHALNIRPGGGSNCIYVKSDPF